MRVAAWDYPGGTQGEGWEEGWWTGHMGRGDGEGKGVLVHGVHEVVRVQEVSKGACMFVRRDPTCVGSSTWHACL